MHPFVYACMTPHGSEIIEELSPRNPDLMKTTRASMERLGQAMKAANPDTIIVITPHGLRLEGYFCVADCQRMVGELADEGAVVRMERRVDRTLARAIAAEAEACGLPIARANFATAEGELSCLPLDWGVIVPLYFMPETKIVVVSPARALPFGDHVRLGEAIARAVRASGKRVGLIASCDWAHAHDANGPYGFHPAAAELDEQVADLVKTNDLEAMTAFSPQLIEDAKPDGIWQALVLAGAIPRADRQGTLLSYEVPTYFGLLCAEYR
ncbi:MAG: extradiol ring-cleavage dioxygenase [Alicyclobacillus sp.]|nr:extradiol ring-cleavage dioxygenase [Alicyclobacillus sp.]